VDNLTNQAWLGAFEAFASRVDLYGGVVSSLRRWNWLATWYPSRSGHVGFFACANTMQSPNFSDLDFTKIVQNHSPCSASSAPTSMLLSGLPQNGNTRSLGDGPTMAHSSENKRKPEDSGLQAGPPTFFNFSANPQKCSRKVSVAQVIPGLIFWNR
jgi:hypothetical protein